MAKRLIEGLYGAEFIVWETAANYCRDNIVISSEAAIGAGAPLRKVKATGVVEPITAANIGSLADTVAGEVTTPALAVFQGFLIDPVEGGDDAGSTTLRAALKKGPAEVNLKLMTLPQGANQGASDALRDRIIELAEAVLINFPE